MIVAGLRRHLAIDEIARGLEIHHRDLRLQQRGLHPLALAGALALGERDQDADRGDRRRREMSATAMPARIGPCPGMPVTHIRPPMPCAIWSKPARMR